tara:strand:+ start:410 stop:1486 length:1077 start_codon:yes stop_codon:yes gene_type:complete
MKKYILLVFLLIQLFGAMAQSNYDAWLEVRGKLGYLAAHNSTMGHLSKEHAKSVELAYRFQTKGNKEWHRAYNYPTLGVALFVSSAGNREVLGTYSGIFGFMNLPLLKTKNFVLAGKMGAGLAYTDKVYNSETNILNVAVSTHINARITLGLDAEFKFGRNAIFLGIDASHYSNSAINTPNFGLNLPFVSVGYAYRIKKTSDSLTTINNQKEIKYWQFGVLGILSVKKINPIGGKHFTVFGANIFARRFINHKIGLELSFDSFMKQSIFEFQEDIPKSQADIVQLGIFLGYILPFDKFHLVTGMGYYVRDKYQPQDFVYHRVGMRYVFDSGLNLNLVLKSHWARADYTEFGIGYTFKK